MNGVAGAGGSDFSPPSEDANDVAVEQATAAVAAPAGVDTPGIEETAAIIEAPPADEEAAAIAGDDGLPEADVDDAVPGAEDDAVVPVVAGALDDGDDAAGAEALDDGDDAAGAGAPEGAVPGADEARATGDLDATLTGKTRAPSGPAPQAAPTGGLGPGAETERFGHQVRHYRMGVSGAALALAWARQENAPNGASVLVEREVSPLGRLGRMWATAPESTLSCAIVLRPPLSVEEADATWLLAGVAAAEGAEVASGRTLATWWPDLVVDVETGEQVAALKVEIQLGPGKVRSAVASIRIDLDKLGLGPEGRDAVFEAVLAALDRNSEGLSDGAASVAAAYEGRCGLLGRRVKLRLLPKGETRGLARSVDRSARLELESATGMVQKIAIDNLRELEAV